MESDDYSQGYYPDEANISKKIDSLIEILTKAGSQLTALRHEFRGEELVQLEDGTNTWVQVTKPLFVRTNIKNEEPLMREIVSTDGKKIRVYIPHDEAIEEILSLIKMCGLNQTTPLGTTDEREMNVDLFEFEKQLSVLLTLKRKEWGIDKSLRPMVYKKIKQVVQDARSLQLNGRVLKSLTQTVKHIENIQLGERKQRTPYE